MHLAPPPHIKLQKKGEAEPSLVSVLHFGTFFHIIYRTELVFLSEKDKREVANECPYLLRSRWLAGENYDWSKIESQQSKDTSISIRWIDDTMGYGVFAEEDFGAGTFIGEYTGVVRRLYRSHPDYNAYCFYYPTRYWSKKCYMIDGLHEGNFTRFINHSNEPNLEPICLIRDRILHFFFVVSRHIPKGTQLTFNYGNEVWANVM